MTRSNVCISQWAISGIIECFHEQQLTLLESIAKVPDWQVAKTEKSSIFWLLSLPLQQFIVCMSSPESVVATGDNEGSVSVEMNGRDRVRVSGESAETLSCLYVPDPHTLVKLGAREEGREGGREGGWGGRERGKEGGREGRGKGKGREGRREGWGERKKERERRQGEKGWRTRLDSHMYTVQINCTSFRRWR